MLDSRPPVPAHSCTRDALRPSQRKSCGKKPANSPKGNGKRTKAYCSNLWTHWAMWVAYKAGRRPSTWTKSATDGGQAMGEPRLRKNSSLLSSMLPVSMMSSESAVVLEAPTGDGLAGAEASKQEAEAREDQKPSSMGTPCSGAHQSSATATAPRKCASECHYAPPAGC